MSDLCYRKIYGDEFLELGEVRYGLDTKFKNCFK